MTHPNEDLTTNNDLQRVAEGVSNRLAGLGTADLHDVLSGRRGPKVVIESDHAVNFGARKIEGCRDPGHRVFGNEAKLPLHRM